MDYQQKIFGKLLEKRRKEKGLTKKELAIMLGYSNISKGIRRVDSIEDGEVIEPVTTKIMEVFAVTQEERSECEQQQAAWLRNYIDSLPPLKPYIIMRIIPAFYVRVEVPQYLSEEEMVKYAIEKASEHKKSLCLMYAREKRYWINENGVYHVGSEFGGGPKMSLDVTRVVNIDV